MVSARLPSRVLLCFSRCGEIPDTPAEAFQPPSIPFEAAPDRIFDSDSINSLGYLPKSIAITGSGIIAIEYGKIFQRLGSRVTLIIRDKVPKNALEKIGLDKDLAALLVTDLVRSGITLERGCTVSSFQIGAKTLSMSSSGASESDCSAPDTAVSTSSDSATLREIVTASDRPPIRVSLSDCKVRPSAGNGEGGEEPARTLSFDAYLAAVGRLPNTEALDLDSVGVKIDSYGNIEVNSKLETSAPGIFAAGDVIGRPFLASTGVAQGTSAVGAMFPLETRAQDEGPESTGAASARAGGLARTGEGFDPGHLAADPFAFPVGIWSSPEAAYFGMTMAQAQERGIEAGEGLALYR